MTCGHWCPYAPFGPTPEERQRQLDAYWAEQQAVLAAQAANPAVQAIVERNLRRLGWRPPAEKSVRIGG